MKDSNFFVHRQFDASLSESPGRAANDDHPYGLMLIYNRAPKEGRREGVGGRVKW